MKIKKPNVVLVLTDDQGYGDLERTGNPIIHTPNIDCLYDQSIRFTDYHVGPTCSPTRAGLMTGHYHNSTGVWHTIGGRSLLRKNEVSIANIFNNNGYSTGIFGKWHLGDNYPYRPHDRGFEEAVVHGGGAIGNTPDYWGNDYFDDTYFNCGKPSTFKGYCTDVFFDLSIDFIERNQNNPFFCYICPNAPHEPLNVPRKYVDSYLNQIPLNQARFYGMITNIDENIGRLRRKLYELDLENNTIFIFMTDNGSANGCKANKDHYIVEGYNAGMRGKKGSPYEGGHRVPFFIHYPNGGYDKGFDVNELTANVDVVPTLIDMCKLKKPELLIFDGVSLIPLMKHHQTNWPERFIVTDSQRIPNPIKWKDSCVMSKKWRLVNKNELYNISEDPEQRKDIAEEYPEKVITMRNYYEQWWEKVSKQFSEEIPIIIGVNCEEVSELNSHDWRGDVGDCAWDQSQIRQGKICNSYWEVEFACDGIYTFELRRWPIEENREMTFGISEDEKKTFPSDRYIEEELYCGGRNIPMDYATICVENKKQTAKITDKDKSLKFEFNIKAGPAHVQTFLENEHEQILGAYYVYVKRIK